MTSEMIRAFHISGDAVTVHPTDWRTMQARYPLEWRREPFTEAEVAAYKLGARQR